MARAVEQKMAALGGLEVPSTLTPEELERRPEVIAYDPERGFYRRPRETCDEGIHVDR